MKLAAVAALAASLAFAPIAAAKKTGIAPITGRILKIEISDRNTVLTIAAGSEHGVEKDHACAFIAEGGTPLVAECTIIRVDKRTTIVKTNMARDKVEHTTVKFGPIVK